MKHGDKSLQKLIQNAIAGRATDEEVDRLGRLIREDEAVCTAYLEAVDAHACLAEDAADISASFPTRKPRWAGVCMWLGLAAAVTLLAVVSFQLLSSDEEVPGDRNFVAVVTNAEGALWEGDDAAVLVVGSRGRSAIREVLLGSVARTAVHRTHRPVLVVHS